MAHYRDKNFKLTPQRVAIMEFLEGNKSHPSAVDTFVALRERFPMMSRATVYNILQTLRDLAPVLELNIDDERKCYYPNTDLRHHLICRKCKEVVDIKIRFELDVPQAGKQGCHVTGTHVEFYGLCPECREKAG